jgi:hypothetical protein
LIDEYIKETGYTGRGGCIVTQKLTTLIYVDPTNVPEFLEHAENVGKQLRKNK